MNKYKVENYKTKTRRRRYKYLKYCPRCEKETKFWTYSGKLTWVCEECDYERSKTYIPARYPPNRVNPIISTSVALFERQIDFMKALRAEDIINSSSAIIRNALDLYFSVFSYYVNMNEKEIKILESVDNGKFIEIDNKIKRLLGVAG
ncbi:hypothetical protein LCGC14_2649780 [marine sediment metagenome]|uniref:Uncharacterized protein n=1 Tax=marine sediment metagenome TaxID=412755 RepID=A0A0F9AHH6_9ZZZZ